jgi:hypothetical protein
MLVPVRASKAAGSGTRGRAGLAAPRRAAGPPGPRLPAPLPLSGDLDNLWQAQVTNS